MSNEAIRQFFNKLAKAAAHSESIHFDLLHERIHAADAASNFYMFESDRNRRSKLDVRGDDFGVGLPPLSCHYGA